MPEPSEEVQTVLRNASDNFICAYICARGMTVTLEQVHEEILIVRKEVEKLTECFHEDQLELSAATKKDVDDSRQQFRQGLGISLTDVEKKVNVGR